MAGASTSVYKFDSMVRGHHIYVSAWTPLTDKTCKSILREDNKRDKYALMIDCSNIQKQDAHVNIDIKSKLIFLNVWQHLNEY